MKRLICNLYLVVLCACAYAQESNFYISAEDDAGKNRELLSATETRYQQDVKALSGKHRKYLEELYKERYDKILKMYDRKEIVTSVEATSYLQQLTAEIVRNNPALQALQPRVCFSRAWWPNASSMGEGTILFNIGLFHKLSNEGQAAFVICHELAHLYLNHSNNSINRYVTTLHSEEFKAEIKRIEKSQYKQNAQLEALVKTLSFRNRRHSREYETEADSLALDWLKNTSFDVQEMVSCLNLLNSVDHDKYHVNPAIDQVLNCKEYPFQSKWIKDEQTLFTTLATSNEQEDKKEEDSLKTHPDCKLRIGNLAARVQQYRKAGSTPFAVNEATFHKLQNDFDYEIIEYCYRVNDISRSMYYSFQMLEQQPANTYLITNIGRCLNQLYAAQKTHTLTNYVDLPSPYYDKKYNNLLHFIQRVRLGDLAAISYYYAKRHQTNLITSEEGLAAIIDSKANFKPEEKEVWVTAYKHKFPNGKYKY